MNYNMGVFQLYRKKLEQDRGRQIEVQQTIVYLEEKLKENGRNLRKHEQAAEVLKTVGIATQKQLEFHISDITSLALEAVFPDPYTLSVEFVERRNVSECDITFIRDGEKLDPITASGGGAVDVAAFALRIASWSMQNPKSRNTIILDEPMRFLSEDYQEQASLMIKEISKRLGIQFIIITHNTTLASYADKVFEISKKRGKSIITTN